jgi:hypothetical protein
MRDHRLCDLLAACASVIRLANHVRHTNAKNPPMGDWSVNDPMNWTDDPFVDVLVNCRLTTLNWGQAFVVDASYWEDSQNLP